MPSALPDELRPLFEEVVRKYHPELLDSVLSARAVQLTVKDRSEMRLSLGRELCETGLNKDDEPNKRGLRIEKLIDWLGRA
jgi:hypothetical protein